jgi:uncharacterized alpha-E superfamily protein
MAQAAFDEMHGQPANGRGETPEVRETYKRLKRWLDETPHTTFDTRRSQAELFFRRVGITFAVYGDNEASERLIPFDIIPRLITKSEWAFLERGLRQRVGALNSFLADLYGPQESIKAGIVPADLILRNPNYRLEMKDRPVPHDVYVHIAGIDVVRCGENDFYVLEDNARTPSGVSYMLENREVMMRLFPELFTNHKVAPVDNYPDALLATLRSVAPAGVSRDPVVAVLTPGRFNSAFYEHTFLADKLGVELVEASDLFVKDEVVFMRTTEGPTRLDVIYRRLDDDFLDPLVFRPDSALGVPGLMGAYRAGNVTLANAVGTGVCDDKAGLQLHARDRALLYGRGGDSAQCADLALPRAGCARPRARQSVRARRQGGERVRRLRHARRPTREQARARRVRPQAETCADRVRRAADIGALDLPDLRGLRCRAPPRRSAPLRADGLGRDPHCAGRPDPGGAQGRIAGGQFESGRGHEGYVGAGCLIPYAQRARSVSHGRRSRTPKWRQAPPQRNAAQTSPMLSRTADSLFWVARYTERADFVARILDAALRLAALPQSYAGGGSEWESAVASAADLDTFHQLYSSLNEHTVRDFLAFNPLNPSSIRNCIEIARENARAVRTALTVEMWDALNGAWLELKHYDNDMTSEEFARFLEWVKRVVSAYDGCAYRTMLRNDAFWFTRLGSAIERADNTARILDVKYHLLLPDTEQVGGSLDYFQWTTILREVSARTAYHWVYRESVKPLLVADLLILNRQMPRSLFNCYENLVRHLDLIADRYGRRGPSQRLARGTLAGLDATDIEAIFLSGLHEFVEKFIDENNRLGAAIAEQYLG